MKLIIHQLPRILLITGCCLLMLAACSQRQSSASPTRTPTAVTPTQQKEDALLGGQTTIFNDTPNAFGQPAPGLEREQELRFFVGNSFFNQNWVQAPASTTARDGLGPLFNTRSCAGCHFKDGRGRAPENSAELGTGFLIRLSVPGQDIYGAPLPEPTYGGQLQDQAIDGLPPEGRIQITYTEIEGEFADGTSYKLRQPTYTFTNLAYGDLHPEVLTSPRVASQMIGLGLLEAVPEETLLALADPADIDQDGISGRPNMVWDALNNQTTIGRFGWKANQPHLLQQVAGAFLGDLGITTDLFPAQNCTEAVAGCQEAVHGGNPEIEADDLHKVTLYSSSLAVPAQRQADEPQVIAGRQIFTAAGCAACHTPELMTGVHPTIPALSHQVIRPYTDLLLHDMGDGLADGRPDFQATGSEWRTPPLWGIGLFATVNHHTTYLHDGRARNLMEAILWHGGEAESAKNHVLNLSASERDALITFLQSL